MPSDTNVVIFAGNLGMDGKVRYSDKGNALANPPICINNTRSGENDPTWVPTVCFGHTAEFLGTLKKGTKLVVIGRLHSTKKKLKFFPDPSKKDDPNAELDKDFYLVEYPTLEVVTNEIQVMSRPKPDGEKE